MEQLHNDTPISMVMYTLKRIRDYMDWPANTAPILKDKLHLKNDIGSFSKYILVLITLLRLASMSDTINLHKQSLFIRHKLLIQLILMRYFYILYKLTMF